MKRFAAVLVALLSMDARARAADEDPPSFHAGPPVSGVVRIWGNTQMASLVERWDARLRRHQAALRLETRLTGSDVGMAALYTGKADIALLGREATASELKAFEWVFRFKPTSIEIATGSLDAPGKSPALVAFVHRDNPLSGLTFAQLDAIFGHERLRGAPQRIDTWGALGLTGEWARRPINLYLFDTESGSGRWFRKVVLEDSRMLNWERLQEFADRGPPGARQHDAGRQILDALARDRSGLAISNLGDRNHDVRPLSLAADGGPRIAPTREALIARSYPLTRVVMAYVKRAPGAPIDGKVAELLRYTLSREGQRAVERDGGYLPIVRRFADREIEKLQ